MRTRTQGYKTELKVNNKQRTLLAKHCGAARFTYNWGLNLKIEAYKNETDEKLNAISLHRKLNSLKKEKFPWMYEVSKCAPQEALRDLDKAYQGFFRKLKSRKSGEKPGFPRFKSKHDSKQSFRLTGSIKVLDENHVQLPRLGKLKVKERGYLPKDSKILSATISCVADRWFVSLQVQEEVPDTSFGISSQILGVDLGINALAIPSQGDPFPNPKALKNKLDKLQRLSRSLSRKKKGSNNRAKAKKKLAKLHYRISCIRKDAIHQMTTALVKTKPKAIVLEDLAVQNMLKNKRLSRSLADSSFGEIRRQLEYKCNWEGIELVLADRFFPSSKRCSGCGEIKKELKLSTRTYVCECCGLRLCRDLNAAHNLVWWYNNVFNIPRVRSGINACGDGTLVPSMKQESNNKSELRSTFV